jgi:ligand-binding SRPBCC domain-containing protein
MRVAIETLIEAPADIVWQHLQTPALLAHVAAPVLRFTPVQPADWPAVWAEGDYVTAMHFLGVLPLGRQTVAIRKGHSQAWPRTVRDAGWGQLVRQWDHLITVAADGPCRTRYRDEVTIGAGLLTPFIWLFALFFYRHRQRRWRRLARTGFAALKS